MWAAWRNIGASLILCSFAVFTVGCQTPSQEWTPGGVLFGRSARPEVKPGQQPEVLTVAPPEDRFNQSVYPAVAFRDMNSQFNKPLTAQGSSLIQSTPTYSTLGTPNNFTNSMSGAPLRAQ